MGLEPIGKGPGARYGGQVPISPFEMLQEQSDGEGGCTSSGGGRSFETAAKQERRPDRMVKSPFCGADEARKSTGTPFANPCRNAFYCVSLRVRLLNIVQNWGIIGARFNKETL